MFVCLFVCSISLTSDQLDTELFPDCLSRMLFALCFTLHWQEVYLVPIEPDLYNLYPLKFSGCKCLPLPPNSIFITQLIPANYSVVGVIPLTDMANNAHPWRWYRTYRY